MNTVRAVLDTNVLISGLLFHGPPRRILLWVVQGKVEMAVSPALEEELERVLRMKFPETAAAVRDLLHDLTEIAVRVLPRRRFSVIREDPADNRVLECALTARVHVILSGDRHLLRLGSFRDVPILSPADFLDRYGSRLAD